MPERVPTQPQAINVLAGSPLESGTPNTGQINFSLGAQKTFSQYSGVAPDVQIQRGAGRLNYAQLLPNGDPIMSGIAYVFYDAHVAAAGIGPVFASGHKLLGLLRAAPDPRFPDYNSGAVLNVGEVRKFGTVYTSGLCMSSVSGQGGVMVGFNPVVSG